MYVCLISCVVVCGRTSTKGTSMKFRVLDVAASCLLLLLVSVSTVVAAPMCKTLQTTTKCTVFVQSDISALPTNVTSLHVVFPSGHRVSLGPGSFPVRPNLRELIVDMNNIDAIQPGAFTYLDGLTSLKLVNTEEGPPGRTTKVLQAGVFSGLAELTSLSIQGTGFNHIGEATFQHLPKLRTLEFIQNNIAILPQTAFTNTTSLVSVKLSNNRITTIRDDCFLGLLNLESLDLSNNQISQLKTFTLGNLPMLKTLNLENNAIKRIEDGSLQGLIAIETLKLQHNELETIDTKMFHSLPGLESLDISYNKITTIADGAFADLFSLQFLEIFNNDFTEFTKLTFNGLGKLIFLDLYNSNITTLDAGIFSDLTELASLHLHNSKIASIHVDAFIGLEKLNILTLQQNALQTIPAGVFEPLKMIGFLDISENPWNCTCHVTWIHRWSQGKNFGNELKTTCQNTGLSLLQYARERYYYCLSVLTSVPPVVTKVTTVSVVPPSIEQGEISSSTSAPTVSAVPPPIEPGDITVEPGTVTGNATAFPGKEGSTGVKLTQTQKAGIIAGAVAFAILLMLLVVLILCCRRHRYAFWKPPPVAHPSTPHTPDKDDKSWLTYYATSRDPNMYSNSEIGTVERMNRRNRAGRIDELGYDNPAHRVDDDPNANHRNPEINAYVVAYSAENDMRRKRDMPHSYAHRVSNSGTHYVDRTGRIDHEDADGLPNDRKSDKSKDKKDKRKKHDKSSSSSDSSDEDNLHQNPYQDVNTAGVAMATINDVNKVDEGREVHETSLDEPEEGHTPSEASRDHDGPICDSHSDSTNGSLSSSDKPPGMNIDPDDITDSQKDSIPGDQEESEMTNGHLPKDDTTLYDTHQPVEYDYNYDIARDYSNEFPMY